LPWPLPVCCSPLHPLQKKEPISHGGTCPTHFLELSYLSSINFWYVGSASFSSFQHKEDWASPLVAFHIKDSVLLPWKIKQNKFTHCLETSGLL
jgi:hypothetical protein